MEKMREFNYPENIFKDPESEDMHEDINRLIGYCVSLGWTNKIMPTEHCKELSNYFLDRMMTYPTHPDSAKN